MFDYTAKTGGRRKLFIHIGMHKTGATSIQKYYARNYDAAIRNGILFPKSASFLEHHFPLALITATPERRKALANGLASQYIEQLTRRPDEEILGEFFAEIAARPDKDVLISTEAFCLLQPEEVGRLCAQFSQFDIYPIVFIRDFNDFAHSFYYSYVADSAGVLPLESCRVEAIFPFDCVALAKLWAEFAANGKTHVCSYDEILRRDETIVGHFAQLIRGRHDLPAPHPAQREHVSISPYALVLIRELRKTNVTESQVRQMIECLRLLPATEAQSLLPDAYRRRLDSFYWSQISALRAADFVKGGARLPWPQTASDAPAPLHISDWSSALLALGRALRQKLAPAPILTRAQAGDGVS
jgi:hypothetical protein